MEITASAPEVTPAAAAPEIAPAAAPKNLLPAVGFLFMLAGPGLLICAGLLTDVFGDFSRTAADIIFQTALVLPGIGAVLAIAALCSWKKTGVPGRALAIVTLIMCNPCFYYFYFIICVITGMELAGVAWGM